MDASLRPYVEMLFSTVKNTISFLQIIDSLHIPEGGLLVTLDVECLFNSTPYELGVQIVQSYLDQMGDQSSNHNRFIIELLKFILIHNYFTFETSLLLQVQGVAMEHPVLHPTLTCT